jgi:hypothetical protein
MVTNLASLGHCDNVKLLMPWRETLYNLPSGGGVMTMSRIASSLFTPGALASFGRVVNTSAPPHKPHKRTTLKIQLPDQDVKIPTAASILGKGVQEHRWKGLR